MAGPRLLLAALALAGAAVCLLARRHAALLEGLRYGAAVMARSGNASQMIEALAASGPFEARRVFSGLRSDNDQPAATLLDGVERMRRQIADPLFDDFALALSLH